ncbi:MAG: hypothetical protein AseanaTS_15050 [Candidatus Pelagadaptatus aseana]|uniref:outer membrane protein assembly factor BamC n=1 Tax=Candidatus Pelagadaptatus aseana TaxID=3120508 RepID=UPI0039B1EE62
MMNRLFLRASLVGSLTFMVGCSSLFGPEGYFRNRGHDYLRSDVIEPMKVPDQVETSSIDQLYNIPPVAEDEMLYSDSFEVPRPLPMAAAVMEDRVKIQSLAERRWILVNALPAEVWPQIRAFLAQNKLDVIYTSASEGVMETSWLKFQDNQSSKDKYRIKIDSGIQPRTTEIHVLHMSMPWGVPGSGQVNWPTRSTSSEREGWMLDELAATLAVNAAPGSSASLLAQTIGVSDRVKLISDAGEPVLSLGLDYTRAWATVNHALTTEGFTLWESDDVVGVHYINYQKSEDEEEVVFEDTTGKKQGLMGGWFDFKGMLEFGGDDKAEEAEASQEPVQKSSAPYSLQDILANLKLEESAANNRIFADINATSDVSLSSAPGYLVVVRGWDGEVQVRVRDALGRNLDPRQARQLLKQIRLNLI